MSSTTSSPSGGKSGFLMRAALVSCGALMMMMIMPTTRAEDLPNCTWCGAGPCDMSHAVVRDHFATSITASVGNRTYPYWRPATQPTRIGDASNATTVVLVHHGAARNGDEYTQYLAPFATQATLVFGAQIFERSDPELDAQNELYWAADTGAEGGLYDWKWGGESSPDLQATISSFTVLDEIVTTIEKTCPNLEKLIIAGHSAGGQIVQRYALFSTLEHEKTKFYPANPSSVTYLSAQRPILDPLQNCDFCVNTTIKNFTFQFSEPDDDCDGTYDQYGYGLEGATPPYVTSSRNATNVTERYASRHVSYLSGESDVCDAPYMNAHLECFECVADDHGLDTSCEAMTQGHCRMQRLHAFAQYVRQYLPSANHPLISVPGVGHNGCAMFQSDQFKKAAFIFDDDDDDETTTVLEDASLSYTWSCDPKDAPYCHSGTSSIETNEDLFDTTLPGNVLMGGGTDVADAFSWQINRSGTASKFLVLRESGTDAFLQTEAASISFETTLRRAQIRRYNSFVLGLGARVAATLILNDERAAEEEFVLSKVAQADAIFFAGGDQSKYVTRIKNSSLQKLLKLKALKVTIGGTSAGNAIMGPYIYTGALGSATSEEVLQNPYAVDVDLAGKLLYSEPLDKARVLMDDHFVTRDRMGRLIVFLARLYADGACCASGERNVRGVGVDEATAFVLDDASSRATLVGDSTAFACEVAASHVTVCRRGEPLTAFGIRCLRLAPGDVFDFSEWDAVSGGVEYAFDVVKGDIVGDAYGPDYSPTFDLGSWDDNNNEVAEF